MSRYQFIYDAMLLARPQQTILMNCASTEDGGDDCDCRFDQVLPTLESFIAQHRLHAYDPVFVVGDKLHLYVNETACYWFRSCCAVGRYVELTQITTLPLVRIRSSQEQNQDWPLRAKLIRHITTLSRHQSPPLAY